MLAARAELLRVEAEVARVPERLLEVEARLLHVAGAGQALDVPEAAHVERALAPADAVLEPVAGPVAVDERVLHEVRLDRGERREPARVDRAHEADERHEEARGVDPVAAPGLDEGRAPRVPEPLVDVRVDRVPRPPPRV